MGECPWRISQGKGRRIYPSDAGKPAEITPLTSVYRALVAPDAEVAHDATVAPAHGELSFGATVGCGAKEFSTGAARRAWGKLLAADLVVIPARGVYCLRSSLVGERPRWPWTRSLAMADLNCSLFRLFLANFPFEFVAQFDEVKGGGTGRGVFHVPFPVRARRQVASLGRLNAQLEFK